MDRAISCVRKKQPVVLFVGKKCIVIKAINNLALWSFIGVVFSYPSTEMFAESCSACSCACECVCTGTHTNHTGI